MWCGLEWNEAAALEVRRTHRITQKCARGGGLGKHVGAGESHTCGDGREQRMRESMLSHREVHKDVDALDPLLAVPLDVRPRQLLRVPGKRHACQRACSAQPTDRCRRLGCTATHQAPIWVPRQRHGRRLPLCPVARATGWRKKTSTYHFESSPIERMHASTRSRRRSQ